MGKTPDWVPFWGANRVRVVALRHRDGAAPVEDAEGRRDKGRRDVCVVRAALLRCVLQGRVLQGRVLQGRYPGLQAVELAVQKCRGAETATEQEGALQQRDQLDGEVVRLGRRLA